MRTWSPPAAAMATSSSLRAPDSHRGRALPFCHSAMARADILRRPCPRPCDGMLPVPACLWLRSRRWGRPGATHVPFSPTSKRLLAVFVFGAAGPRRQASARPCELPVQRRRTSSALSPTCITRCATKGATAPSAGSWIPATTVTVPCSSQWLLSPWCDSPCSNPSSPSSTSFAAGHFGSNTRLTGLASRPSCLVASAVHSVCESPGWTVRRTGRTWQGSRGAQPLAAA